jgi:long-subunit acyl-CoA synthetase (AMP-forming)
MIPYLSASGRSALADANATLSTDELAKRVTRLASAFADIAPPVRVLGLQADNGVDWVVLDLAAQAAGIALVPLPAFFTQDQCEHAIAVSGMDAIVTVAPPAAQALGFGDSTPLPGIAMPMLRRHGHDAAVLPPGTAKVTFTSGTTGEPKGICLDARTQWGVAEALSEALAGVEIERHLCLLPLPVLLENIAGVYAPMVRGAVCFVPSLREVGLTGASAFDAMACLAAIERYDAHSVILLPQMLAALTETLAAGATRPSCLRFAAVGGAKVSPALIARARGLGIPVFEGYGLSECASVVALNVPGRDRQGSVGRPLAHADVRIAADGEIVVRGHAMLGQTGDRQRRNEASPIFTGDIGRIDADGFLHIDGRRKQQLITSFGRNVAPEWPEAELLAGRTIAQAVVFGEARPALSAVLVPRFAEATDAMLDADVDGANRRLPDYARIAAWIRADTPFHAGNGLATANGRPRRDAILARYDARIDALYEHPTGDRRAVL